MHLWRTGADARERREKRAVFFLPGVNCPQTWRESVMRHDARNSATEAPRFNSSAWRAPVPPASPSRTLSIYLCRWHDGTRFVVTLWRALRRSFCRWQLRDTKWAAHSVSHAPWLWCADCARSPVPPSGGCRPSEVTRLWHDTPMSHRLSTVVGAPIRLERG